MPITQQQDNAATALLAALTASAELAPDTGEGSAGHLRDDAVQNARTDLEYIRNDPASPILALADGVGHFTLADWMENAAQLLADWHATEDPEDPIVVARLRPAFEVVGALVVTDGNSVHPDTGSWSKNDWICEECDRTGHDWGAPERCPHCGTVDSCRPVEHDPARSTPNE